MRYPKYPILRRLFLELWFTCHVLKTVLRIRNKIDIAVVIFPPSLFVCMLGLVLPKRVEVVGIVHDLQGVLGLAGANVIKRIFSYLVKKVEKYGFNKCRNLILVSEGIKNQVIQNYGVDSRKCVVHYPFVTQSDEVGNGDILCDKFQNGFKHIVYSGALGEKQNPFELLEIFKALVGEREDVVCHFFSGGPLYDLMEQNQSKNLTERIHFHSLVAENNLTELFDRSTLHVIPQKPGTAAAAFPSKLPNIIAAGVPVFAITDFDSELSRLVNKSGIGKCCSTWDRDVVVHSLSDFIDHIKNLQRSVNKYKVKDFVTEYFNVENVIDSILDSTKLNKSEDVTPGKVQA